MDKKALFKIQCGLFVAAVGTPKKTNGCVTNTLMEQSHVPMKFSVTFEKTHLTHDMIMEKKSFGISALAKNVSVELIRRFGFASGRDVEKFSDFDAYATDINGNPVLTGEQVAATYSLEVYDTVDVGTHTIFLCTAADMCDFEAEAITYSEYRASLKK